MTYTNTLKSLSNKQTDSVKFVSAEFNFDLAITREKRQSKIRVFVSLLCIGSVLLTVAVSSGFFVDFGYSDKSSHREAIANEVVLGR